MCAASKAGREHLLVDVLLDVAVGRGKGEGLPVGVPVDLLFPQAPPPLIVADSVAAMEVPWRESKLPQVVDNPQPLARRDAQHTRRFCNVCRI